MLAEVIPMLRKLLYIIIINSTLLTITSFSQSITWQWLSQDHTSAISKVQQTFDGGYIAVGSARINNEYKIRLIKFDAFGDTLWSKIFGIGASHGNWVEQTSDSGYIIGGSTDSGTSNSKAYLVKTNKFGNILWSKTYSNSNDDGCICARQIAGGYILSCVTWPGVARLIWLIKTDSVGNLIWQKFYGDGVTTLVMVDLQKLNNGYVATGFKGSSPLSNVFLIKLNLNGDTLWTRTFGSNESDIGYSLTISPNAYIIAGSSKSFSTSSKLEAYVVKTDTNGNFQWQRTYSHLGQESAQTIRYKSGTGYIFAGYSDSLDINRFRAKIRAIDLSGNLIFETSFTPMPEDASFYSMELTTDGGFILGGEVENNMYVVKTDSLGNANPIGIVTIQNNIPVDYQLYQNYPNPFNPTTNIKFQIAKEGFVKLSVYDILGRQVTDIFNEELKAGTYEAEWNASNYPSGIYFYRLITDTYTQSRKMILIK